MDGQTSDRINQPHTDLTRLVSGVLILLFALALLIYGAFARSVTVLPQQLDKKQPNLVLTEPQIVRDVTFGGLVRLDSGTIRRTYSGKPPQACPT